MSYTNYANRFLWKTINRNDDECFDPIDIGCLYVDVKGKSYDEKVSFILKDGICASCFFDKENQKRLAEALAKDFEEVEKMERRHERERWYK